MDYTPATFLSLHRHIVRIPFTGARGGWLSNFPKPNPFSTARKKRDDILTEGPSEHFRSVSRAACCCMYNFSPREREREFRGRMHDWVRFLCPRRTHKTCRWLWIMAERIKMRRGGHDWELPSTWENERVSDLWERERSRCSICLLINRERRALACCMAKHKSDALLMYSTPSALSLVNPRRARPVP